MRTHLHILTGWALLAASCATEEVPAPREDIDTSGYTTFTADIESLVLPPGQEGLWQEDAAIGVFASESGSNEKYILRSADEGLATALFYGPSVKGAAVSAYYPYSESASGSSKAISTSLSPQQEYIPGNGPLEQFMRYSPRAFAFLADGVLKFRYPFGLLKVEVAIDETVAVEGMTLSSSTVPLSGLAVVEAGGVEMAGAAGSPVTLSCPEGGVSSRTSEGAVVPFYLTVAAGVFEELVLRIDVAGEDAIVCILHPVEIPRVDAASFSLASVKVQSGGPADFDPVIVHFDE